MKNATVGIDCVNPDHPDGAWHPASPLPASWQWGERIRQWYRIKKWGCGCEPDAERVLMPIEDVSFSISSEGPTPFSISTDEPEGGEALEMSAETLSPGGDTNGPPGEKDAGGFDLLEIIEALWQIIDDIDTASDAFKFNDRDYRKCVERLQSKRWETGITTDGHTLTISQAGPCLTCGDTRQVESDYPGVPMDCVACIPPNTKALEKLARIRTVAEDKSLTVHQRWLNTLAILGKRDSLEDFAQALTLGAVDNPEDFARLKEMAASLAQGLDVED